MFKKPTEKTRYSAEENRQQQYQPNQTKSTGGDRQTNRPNSHKNKDLKTLTVSPEHHQCINLSNTTPPALHIQKIRTKLSKNRKTKKKRNVRQLWTKRKLVPSFVSLCCCCWLVVWERRQQQHHHHKLQDKTKCLPKNTNRYHSPKKERKKMLWRGLAAERRTNSHRKGF